MLGITGVVWRLVPYSTPAAVAGSGPKFGHQSYARYRNEMGRMPLVFAACLGRSREGVPLAMSPAGVAGGVSDQLVHYLLARTKNVASGKAPAGRFSGERLVAPGLSLAPTWHMPQQSDRTASSTLILAERRPQSLAYGDPCGAPEIDPSPNQRPEQRCR
jgi:hypothetical protein